MDSKGLLLSTTLFTLVGLVGCQTVPNNEIKFSSGDTQRVNQVGWEKSGELFRLPNDSDLKANERRIVFFRDAHHEKKNNINIGIGLDNVFQTSLDNGHYSEKIICDNAQIINASVLKENGDIVSYSESFQFLPQKTTYIRVSLTATGKPVLQQISANEALSSLSQANRQTHQISRMPSDCSMTSQTLLSQPLPNQNLPKESVKKPIVNTPVDISDLKQFSVLFDFDSANLKNNNNAVLDGMASFIQSYPRTNITVEGHTDSRGSESYNLQLSQKRANTVKNILVDKYGMQPSRLRAVGYGEAMPIDTNDTEEGRQNNRRVVATVSEKVN